MSRTPSRSASASARSAHPNESNHRADAGKKFPLLSRRTAPVAPVLGSWEYAPSTLIFREPASGICHCMLGAVILPFAGWSPPNRWQQVSSAHSIAALGSIGIAMPAIIPASPQGPHSTHDHTSFFRSRCLLKLFCTVSATSVNSVFRQHLCPSLGAKVFAGAIPFFQERIDLF